MNKTININLANTFFHIDEEAYLKLQRYLDAVKRSFTKSQGEEEIISDIEARIAELFSERLQHDRQVITIKEVEEIIGIMGQPEDYLVDEELFEDTPKKKSKSQGRSHTQLFRDIDRKYIGGVCAGLSHYFKLDVLWIRLIFILIAVISFGMGILIYLIFWILVPEAVTTAQKIAMVGDPVNISNIEKKIREGFEDVTEKVKSVDYDKMGATVKKNSKNFFESLASIFMVIVNIFAKFVGIIILITAATALIALFYGFFTAGTMEIWGAPWNEYIHATIDAPIWVISLLFFLVIGIPLFFLFYLGLKILVNNLKSIGNFAKFTLLGLWLLAVIGITILGIKTASSYAFHASETQIDYPDFSPSDTLEIRIASSDALKSSLFDSDDFLVSNIVMVDGQKYIYNQDIDIRLLPAEDGRLKIEIERESQGESQNAAYQRAEEIIYDYTLNQRVLNLNNYLMTALEHNFREQEVTVSIYLPTTTVVKLHPSTRYYINTSNDMGYGHKKRSSQLWQLDSQGELKCIDCQLTPKPLKIEPNTARKQINHRNEIDSVATDTKNDSI